MNIGAIRNKEERDEQISAELRARDLAARAGEPECQRDHEPDEDDLAFARETLPHGTEDEVYDLAVQRVGVRCREEPCGAGEDPYGRTKEDWERHAE